MAPLRPNVDIAIPAKIQATVAPKEWALSKNQNDTFNFIVKNIMQEKLFEHYFWITSETHFSARNRETGKRYIFQREMQLSRNEPH